MVYHAIFINGGKTAVAIQPAISTYRPGFDRDWEIREVPQGFVNDGSTPRDSLPLIDGYKRPKLVKPFPITSFKGSWADCVSRNR